METLEDLAKIAEILARPILHTTIDKEHTFYIIDNDTKYQYKVTNEKAADINILDRKLVENGKV